MLRVSGKQNSLFPLGPVIKCLIIQCTYKFLTSILRNAFSSIVRILLSIISLSKQTTLQSLVCITRKGFESNVMVLALLRNSQPSNMMRIFVREKAFKTQASTHNTHKSKETLTSLNDSEAIFCSFRFLRSLEEIKVKKMIKRFLFQDRQQKGHTDLFWRYSHIASLHIVKGTGANVLYQVFVSDCISKLT